jgi:hypothetical protein
VCVVVRYEDPVEVDKLQQIHKKIEGVKDVMQDNIKQALASIEATDQILQKSGPYTGRPVIVWYSIEEF